MRKRVFSLWIVAALVVLGACAPTVGGSSVDPPTTQLSATLQMPASLPDGETVKLQFTLTNNSDVDLYVLKWYTPLEGIGGEIFGVERDGQAIPYVGILAMRGDPTPEGYGLLEAGQSASAEVDLATSFDFSQPGEYTIEFLSPRISHVARSEAEMARSVDDLGPVAMPSNQVSVTILEDL
jgi:peptidyl-Lys metalloendopeptidase